MPYYFYIARCADNSLYSGFCKDIKLREAKHNSGTGAKYTASRRPVKFVYFEEYANRADAMKREAQVKKLSKKEKEKIVLKR